jgi:choline dehydrogenase
VIADSPAVGSGLQDHLAVNYFYRSRVPTLNDQLAPFFGKVKAALRYACTRGGPLSMSVNQAGAFLRSRPEYPRPNLHIYFNPASYSTTTAGAKRRLTNPDPWSGYLISFNTCRPTSRGSVHIRSPDPHVSPTIVPNSLSTPGDVEDVFDGARLVRRIAASVPLAAITESEHQPGAAVTADAAVLTDFRQRAGSVFHASCTCSMGSDPRSAALDSRLRVRGAQGLRVVDASAFPNVTSGNTNTPTIMLAERGADLILQDSRAPPG